MTSLLPRGQPTCLAEGDGRGDGGSHWVDRQQGDPVGRWVQVGLGGGGLQPGCVLSVCVGGGVSRHLQLMTPNLILTKRILFYISPQEREISVPILSRSAFPRSCTKFAFPRARVPKMPGTRERKTKNARPPLEFSLATGLRTDRIGA